MRPAVATTRTTAKSISRIASESSRSPRRAPRPMPLLTLVSLIALMMMLAAGVAAGDQPGAAYLSVGVSAAGAERRHATGLQPVAGADAELTVAGNDLLAEFAYARSPENRIDDEWGLYLQDTVPLRESLYAVVRYEHFRSFRDGVIDAGIVGIAWRLHTHFIIKADYQFTTKPSEDVPRGLLASFSLF